MSNLDLIRLAAKDNQVVAEGLAALESDLEYNFGNTSITDEKYKEMLDALTREGKLPGGKVWANSSKLYGVVVKDGNIFNPYIHRYNMTYRVLDPLITMASSDEVKEIMGNLEDSRQSILFEMFRGSLISHALTHHDPSMQLGRCWFAPNIYNLKEPIPGKELSTEDLIYNDTVKKVCAARSMKIVRNWSTEHYLIRRLFNGANRWLAGYVVKELAALEKGGVEFVAKYRYAMGPEVAEYLTVAMSKQSPQGLRCRLSDMRSEFWFQIEDKKIKGTKSVDSLKKLLADKWHIFDDILFDIYVRAGLVGTLTALHNFPDNYLGLNAVETFDFETLWNKVKDLDIKEGNFELYKMLSGIVASGDVEVMNSHGKTFLI